MATGGTATDATAGATHLGADLGRTAQPALSLTRVGGSLVMVAEQGPRSVAQRLKAVQTAATNAKIEDLTT